MEGKKERIGSATMANMDEIRRSFEKEDINYRRVSLSTSVQLCEYRLR